MMLDAIVIGGGPAGLSAATWLARYRRTVLVLDSGEYRNRWADASHGYFSRDPANPSELLARARADLGAYPTAEVRHALAVKAAPDGEDRFEVVTETERFVARRLVLATGVRDQFPEVEGFFEHYGVSVFHCPSCDGYEAKGRPVVAIGWTEQVAGFALELLGWASQVTVVTDGRRFQGTAATATPWSGTASRSARRRPRSWSGGAVTCGPSAWRAATWSGASSASSRSRIIQ
jgi:thioredoxin reductase